MFRTYCRRPAFCCGVFVAALFAAVCAGQPNPCGPGEWVLRSTTGPSPRYGHAMAYDSARGVTVLFGGSSGPGETWEWDGNSWTQRLVPAPPVATKHAMAYDSSREVIVMCWASSVTTTQTWEWDGVAWTLRATTGLEHGLFYPAMAFDAARNRTVLFGGLWASFGGQMNWHATYEWDGQAWGLPVSETTYFASAMAYDGRLQRVVRFGGGWVDSHMSWRAARDTAEWSGSTWNSLPPTSPLPTGRYGAALVDDTTAGYLVLFGGFTSDDFFGFYNPIGANETWERAESIWGLRSSVGPIPRVRHAMAFDSARGVTVLFGGEGPTTGATNSETWEWKGPGTPLVGALPATLNVNNGANAVIQASAAGFGDLSYQWRKNGEVLSNGGHVSGATSPTLTISPVHSVDAGTYSLAVSNPCGTSLSSNVQVTVNCYPDCDRDGILSLADFGCFETNYGRGLGNYWDCDRDGQRTVADFGCFQNSFGLGCP